MEFMESARELLAMGLDLYCTEGALWHRCMHAPSHALLTHGPRLDHSRVSSPLRIRHIFAHRHVLACDVLPHAAMCSRTHAVHSLSRPTHQSANV
eukprot:46937-Pleurochrysis_carterae.AAC.1